MLLNAQNSVICALKFTELATNKIKDATITEIRILKFYLCQLLIGKIKLFVCKYLKFCNCYLFKVFHLIDIGQLYEY